MGSMRWWRRRTRSTSDSAKRQTAAAWSAPADSASSWRTSGRSRRSVATPAWTARRDAVAQSSTGSPAAFSKLRNSFSNPPCSKKHRNNEPFQSYAASWKVMAASKRIDRPCPERYTDIYRVLESLTCWSLTPKACDIITGLFWGPPPGPPKYMPPGPPSGPCKNKWLTNY